MAKTKISEYSSTANNNTDINSINLAEGMAPSLVNNAIRQLMAQLKNFQDGSAGDNVTVGGNLSVTGTSTLTGTLTATAGLAGPLTSSSATITGGTINGAVIGGSSAQAITGTNVTATVGFTGPLTGAVTGNTTGTHTGAVTGNVTGNLTGNVTGNVTAASGTSTFNNVTISGSLDMDSGTSATITGLANPVNDSDAANKGYVDALAQGIDAKASVVVATTANITLSGTQTIDGISVSVGDRVLVKDQTTQSGNGIYLCAASTWTRTTDANTWDELVAAFTFVERGTTQANNGYISTITAGGTLGTTAVTFAQFSGAGQITAGDGLTKTGNTLNVGTASSGRIVVNSDNIDLATSGVTAGTYKSVTADAYGRITAGTNPTTLSGFGIADAYTIAQIDTLFGSTSSAATSAAAAATSASNASTSASNASTSAGNASTSATAAAASATSASNTYDAFDDRYLGSKSSAPSVDNDGNALLTGALYWNTAVNTLYVWTGSTWTQAAFTAGGFLVNSNNLSDVSSTSTARTNLGLATVAATGSYNDLSNKPTIITTATNLAGGSNGTIPYQSASGATAMLAAGTAGQVLTSNGAAAPTWAAPPASAGTVTAVASGSLSDGSMVILNSDGTVSVPVATAADTFQNTSSGSTTSVAGYIPLDNAYRNISACYNPNTKTVVIFYIDSTNFYLNAVSGTVSGGTITLGVAVRIYSNVMLRGTQSLHAACDTINNIFLCLYRYNGSTAGSHAWCQALGTTISASAQYNDTWGSQNPTGYTLIIAPTLNGANVQALIYYNASSTGLSYVIACTCPASGDRLTIGSQYDLSSDVGTMQMLGCFGATPNIAVVPYRSLGGTVCLNVVTLNGTSATLSFQGQMSTDTSSGYPFAVAYSATLNKFMALWSRAAGDMRGSIFTLSGTTPTFGASTSLSGYGSTALNGNLVVDQATGFFYAGNTIYMSRITVSGLTFTSGTINAFVTPYGSAYQGNAIYDSNGLGFMLPYLSNPLTLAYAQGFTSTLTSTNFLGVSNAAYTNGQTATIQTVGSTDNAQTGLTIGKKYYVTPSGTLSTLQTSQPYAGLALTATNLVVKG